MTSRDHSELHSYGDVAKSNAELQNALMRIANADASAVVVISYISGLIASGHADGQVLTSGAVKVDVFPDTTFILEEKGILRTR